jgi:putative transposase
MVKDPGAYPWSSAAAHISGRSNDLVEVKPLLEMVGNWRDFLQGGVSEEEIKRIRRHERTGRPLGNDGFVEKLEEGLGRVLKRRKPGPKRGHKHK